MAGGVGTALLELGKLAGLEVYGTASSHNHEVISGHGATPIDYRTEDFVKRIRDLTSGMPITTLTGAIDQAALQGLLRRLYGLGLPLISVNWIKGD